MRCFLIPFNQNIINTPLTQLQLPNKTPKLFIPHLAYLFLQKVQVSPMRNTKNSIICSHYLITMSL